MGVKVDISGGGIGVIQPGAKHGLILVGKVVESAEDQTEVGYMLYDVMGDTVQCLPYKRVQGMLSKNKIGLLSMLGYKIDFLNFKYATQGKVTPLWGDEDSLPVVTLKKEVVKQGVYVISKVQDDKGKDVGVVVITSLGTRKVISMRDLAGFMDSYPAVNCLPVGDSVVRMDGQEFPIQTLAEKNMDLSVQGSLEGHNTTKAHNRCDVEGADHKPKVETVAAEGYDSNGDKITNFPFKPVYDIQTLSETERKLSESAGFMLIEVEENLAKVAPYYCSMFRAIETKPYPDETDDTITWGVSEKELFYGSHFTLNHSIAELSFVAIHEILHLALQHHARKGKRDHELWNIATDMMINAMICDEFGLTYESGEIKHKDGVIAAIPSGIYPAKFNKVLDFHIDTEESIYAELWRENQGDGGDGDDGDGDQGDQGDQGQSGKGKPSKNGNGKGQGQGESDQGEEGEGDEGEGEGQGNGQGSGQGKGNGKQDQNQKGQGSGGSGEKDKNQQGQESGKDDKGKSDKGNSNGKTRTVTYNGVTCEVPLNPDLRTELTDTESKDADATQTKRNQMSREQLSRMQAQVAHDKQTGNAGFDKDGGAGVGGAGAIALRSIDYGLSQGVNWKRALQNAIKYKPQKMYTLGSPNRLFMGQGMTVATQQRIGKPSTVTGAKICIDVSGSVSQEVLNRYLSEVAMLFRRHKVTGELIYWSTEIGGVGEVEHIRDMLKVPPHSTGGTDVKCVFEYLTREKPFEGKKQPVPLKDIPLIIIITDGAFYNNYEQYGSKLGRKVLWIIDGNPRLFKPPFGKVIGIDDAYYE